MSRSCIPAQGARRRWTRLNAVYDRDARAAVPPTGWALLALMAAIDRTLAAPLARLLPGPAKAPEPLGWRRFALVLAAPLPAAPLLAAPLEIAFLPVLVADYLALHLALYGAIQIAILWRLRGRLPRCRGTMATVALVFYALGLFGLALRPLRGQFQCPPATGWRSSR